MTVVPATRVALAIPADPEPARPSACPDVFNPACGSREVLELIADKWSALILYALLEHPRRHGELRRAIGGVSQKMLTQTLRALETGGLVARESFPVVPPHVEYSLTELGRSLSPLLGELCRWAEQHLPEIQAARLSQATTIVETPPSTWPGR